jgi:hypothetical protein
MRACCPEHILAAETVVYVTVFDLAFAIHHCLKQILSRELPLYLFADSSSLFSTVTKFQAVREKRLSIDLAVLRQAYQRREVTNFGFVKTEFALAGPCTKCCKSPLLNKLLEEGKLSHPVAEYVVNDGDESPMDIRFIFASDA